MENQKFKACKSVHHLCAWYSEGQKRVSDSLELELQTLVSHHVDVGLRCVCWLLYTSSPARLVHAIESSLRPAACMAHRDRCDFPELASYGTVGETTLIMCGGRRLLQNLCVRGINGAVFGRSGAGAEDSQRAIKGTCKV